MKIDIKGPIISDGEQWIYDYFEIPATSALKVNKALEKANGEDVEVIINSCGGSVFAGSEIYTVLKDYKGKTTGKIVGVAASAAGVASMGVDSLLISPTAQIMIHNASMRTEGNHTDLEKDAQMLKGTDKAIANAYMLKTKMQHDELLDLMEETTWLTAQQAKEKGFVDSIMFDDGVKLVASVDDNGLLPQAVIDKVRNELVNKKELENKAPEAIEEELKATEELELAKAKLKLALI